MSFTLDRRTVTALLVAGTFFMEILDATVITTALPQMAKSFSVAPVDLNTGVSAYMLTLGIFIPVSGWVAERFGARRVFAAAIALFTFSSLLCGLSTSLSQFVAMRVLQGIGGAMMVPVGRLVVLKVTPKDRLIGAIATLTWPALVAPVLGPPLGGLIAQYASWRWIFFLNLPLGVLAFALSWRILPETERVTRAFDWSGFLLLGGALFGLLLSADLLARPEGGWRQAAAAAAVGLALLLAGVAHLNRTANPMLNLHALRLPTFAVTIGGGSLFCMGVSAVPFLLPLMFQIGFGASPVQAGLLLMAVFAGNLTMKPMTTGVLRRFGFRPVLLVNGLINATAIAACAGFTAAMPLWLVAVVLFIGGMSRSMQFTALNTIAFADVPQEGMASANTLFSTAFQLAMGLGIALGAIGWRVGEALTGGAARGAAQSAVQGEFRIAFLIVAAVALLGTLDGLRLERDAADHVARRK